MARGWSKLVTDIEPSYEPPCSDDDYLHDGEPVLLFRNDLKYLGLGKSLLPSTGLLPEVRAISEIDVITGKYRMHPSIYAVLAKSLPSIHRVNFTLAMPTRRYMFQRRHIRSALADALRDASLDNLEALHIQLHDGTSLDERLGLDVLTNSRRQDDLSLAVQVVLKLPNLREASFLGGWILAP
ncbi:uncharacterized protein ColSpa_01959 [Colletotrichum spaethianum]|uniref:Uncharacterized protein n=1 Tax=Colletotrichum spaethianum TaxID=700344 RepID=A0AA37L8T3_9PEZI|nr:uncharacterized protein ColSpa_01959 [Colletotrichum spaethianum]GKT41778.1 hypothetical protein ColSpa_01959 [Colletotrichum spaethianum]